MVNFNATQKALLDHLSTGPTTATVLAEKVELSRQAVHRQLVQLAKAGLVSSTGKARATVWTRTVDATFEWPIVPSAQEDQMWAEVQARTDLMEGSSNAAMRSLAFGVTEMLNNAIDHSRGTTIGLNLWRQGRKLTVEIRDDGIGVFANVQQHFGLQDEREAIAHLAKGKQTTAAEMHSGQGIFFTSKLFDYFDLESHERVWSVDNVRNDQTIKSGGGFAGTRVLMTLNLDTKKQPREVFDRFTDAESLEFVRSAVHVSLAQYGTEFVSRSEAKRLAAQLELFGEVVLDFEGVDAVGQAFVDEMFRVWSRANPGTRLTPVNMNGDVAFMVRRGLASHEGFSS